MKLEQVPVIDISPFWSGDSSVRNEVAAQVSKAVREIGFLVIKGHGVPESVMEVMEKTSQAFFDLPMETKIRIKNVIRGSMRGYMPYGEEALSYTVGESAPPDLKEGFQMGRPNFSPEESYSPEVKSILFNANVWPPEMPELETVMTAYYKEMDRVTRALLRIFAVALKLPEGTFESDFDRPASVIRVNNYPAQEKAPEPGQIRAGAHTDYGILTILKPDYEVGGLQVQNFKGEWVEAPLVPGTFIINIGDMMMRWTNDTWLSNMHRVVNPASGGNSRRLSIAFFAYPNAETVVECIPTCTSDKNPAKYPPTLAMQSRMEKIIASIDQTANT